jgi:hypothetical protein
MSNYGFLRRNKLIVSEKISLPLRGRELLFSIMVE